MRPKISSKSLRSLVPACYLAAAFMVCCSYQARSTVVRMVKAPPQAEEYEADEFTGTPIMGDHDEDENLDFVIRVDDLDRVFKIYVHKDVAQGDRETIEKIRSRINEVEDQSSLRVTGYYTPEYRGEDREYGFLELESIVFFDDRTGHEETFFTEPKNSRLKNLLFIPFLYLTFVLFLS
ncbi:MAG TPA: hypothetical protein VM123_12730 [archaeon]|nr:hypothetical protein [archaeon]